MSFDKLILMLESYIKHGRELHDQFLSEIKLYSMFVYHELLIAKFSLKMKKVKKTTRPFRYYLSQIPYDYAVEVTSRVKGLDLMDRVPEELQTEVHDTVQEAVIKITSKRKKCKKAKCLSEGALQIAVKRREAKGKGEKERYTL